MKKYALWIFTYAVTPIFMFLLYFFSTKQEGQEWLFSSFIVFMFSLFLVLWKQFAKHAIGLTAMTAFTLLMLNSVLYLTPQEMSVIFVSFMIGVLLVLHRKTAKEGIVASLGLVLLNMTLFLPLSNTVLLIIALVINALICAVCWLKFWTLPKWLYSGLTVITLLLLIISFF